MAGTTSLLECIAHRWSPGIGDPTVFGWIVVAAYAAAALAAGSVAVRGAALDRRERAFWVLAGIVMAALAVNKQLDLQSALTAAGRCLAQSEGWYESRRIVQARFVEALALLSGLAALAGLFVLRGHLTRCGPAIVGLAAVVGYVLIRAVGFHHVDVLISTEIVRGVDANPVLELAGIVLVALNAAARRATLRRVRVRGRARARP